MPNPYSPQSRKFTFCGTGILPVLENSARSQVDRIQIANILAFKVNSAPDSDLGRIDRVIFSAEGRKHLC
jgi:hypothetical protein